MDKDNLLQKLKDWRRRTANSEGIEPFRVFANKVLDNIAEVKPANKEELMTIKGIRYKKFARYGRDILVLINPRAHFGSELNGSSFFKSKLSVGVNNGDEGPGSFIDTVPDTKSDKPFSVSQYLDFLNKQLSKCRARIQGEISSLDIRDNYLFFSLKDKDDRGILSCFMWKSDYRLSGIEFEVGAEVILEGCPEAYKPTGRLSFKASSAELVGEGALKKAYDQLKKKLEAEGLFLESRKRQIPNFPQKIGLITSETGAVIHDFLTNLGRYGFQIKFMNSRVEGQGAIRDLISAIEYFGGKEIDVLVIIRGGGSLESLRAFNNETLVRKIADFSKPVICGIGHEKDAPLASLAADKMVSTPTAVTLVLNESWQEAIHLVELNREKIFNSFRGFVFGFNKAEESLKRLFVAVQFRISEINRNLAECPRILNARARSLIKDSSGMLASMLNPIFAKMEHALIQTNRSIVSAEKLVVTYNPERQLRLGYSIVRSGGTIVRKISQIKIGQLVNARVEDGAFESEVKKLKPSVKK